MELGAPGFIWCVLRKERFGTLMCFILYSVSLFRGSTILRSVQASGKVYSVTAMVLANLPGQGAYQPFLGALLSFLLFILTCLVMTWAPAAAMALPQPPVIGQSYFALLPSPKVDQDGPLLAIISPAPLTTGQMITIAINFQNNGFNIVATSFSLDLDQSCLAFDPTDQNKDGRPDAIIFYTPAGISAAAIVDLQDSDSELDFLLADYFPPFTTLPNRAPLIEIGLRTICQPAAGSTSIAPIRFAADPVPSFGSINGASVPGTAIDGVVTIQGPTVTATPTPTATPIVIPTGAATTTPTVPATFAPTPTPTITPTPTLLPTTFPTTLVAHFTATTTADGIQLGWQTRFEAATAGFYLYRKRLDWQSSSFDFHLLTTLLPGQGSGGGLYQVQDEQVEPTARYLYLLVEEKANGERLAYIDLMVLVTLPPSPPHQAWLPLIRR